MNTTRPSRTASAGDAPAGMPARLWEVAKHGARGTIPQWVRAAPDAGATAPARIGQIARRAAQVAAAAGVVGGGIGAGMGATEAASRPVDLAHTGDGAPGADHTSTGPGGGAPQADRTSTGPGGGAPGADHTSTGPGGGAPQADHTSTGPGTGSPASSDSGDAPGPPGSASEGGVTLHTSGDGGHLASGLATTWRIPGHGAVGGEHGDAGAEGGHGGLTVEMYQDVVVNEGADGMFSVDAVEYVVVGDEHGHAYVFRDDYHTVVPDPPGQETDLVIHETDRAQVVEHPDGSFSVTQADNSISVTVGSDGDGQHEVTVTQTESLQIGHDPRADGHDTVSLTENESGSTTSDQTEVVTEQTLPREADTPQPSASVPQPAGGEPGRPAQAGALGGPTTQAGEASGQRDDGAVYGTAGSTTSPPASAAASSQVGTAPSAPETVFAARVMSTPPPLATSLGGAPATAGGLTPGHESHPPAAFAGLRGGPAEPGHGAAPAGHFPNEPVPAGHFPNEPVPAGHFPNEPVPAQHPAGGAFDSAPGSAGSRPFEHPATEPPAGAPGPDPHHGAMFADHDQPGLDEPGAHADIGLAAVDPAEPGPGAGADTHSVGEHEEASGAPPDSSAGSAHAPSWHDPGTGTTVIH